MSHSRRDYDVVVIGAGPAGIFACLELAQCRGLKVLLLEKGKDLDDRLCPSRTKGKECSAECAPCSITSGWGGAGAFSDGKLTLTTEFGGQLDKYVGRDELSSLVDYVDRLYLQFGATAQVFAADEETTREIHRKAAGADLIFVPARIRHLGTENCVEVLRRMRQYLDGLVEISTGTAVASITVDGGSLVGVETTDGQVGAKFVVCAPGREGAEWFISEADRLGLDRVNNPVDLGVRVEVSAAILQDLTDAVYESKFIFYSKTFDDKVRTFCMNPRGEVVRENSSGLVTVNGHSYAERKTDNTNFALLVSKSFTEPFKEPIAFGKHIAGLANLLSTGVIVQRLGDLMAGRRSTEARIRRGMVEPTLKDATPGDLSLVMPYRHLIDILEMLKALDLVAPGVCSRHTLLYGVEVKFYSARLRLNRFLETQVPNLFAAGDGAGVTRGLVQASASGVIAAREILKRAGPR